MTPPTWSTEMNARQRCALACLRINHPRAHVVPVPNARDRDPVKVKVKMSWRNSSRVVWLRADGGLELGDVHVRMRQAVPA